MQSTIVVYGVCNGMCCYDCACMVFFPPREWMDVLSPPIMTPSQQRRSGNTLNNKENQVAATSNLNFTLFFLFLSTFFLSFEVGEMANDGVLTLTTLIA